MASGDVVVHRISGAWTRSVMTAIERLGLDAEQVCRRAGVDHLVLHDTKARIPHDDLVRFWNAATASSGDVALGLHAGEQLGARYNHVLAMLVFTGKTLGEGVELGVRYQNIIADGRRVSVSLDGADRVVRFSKVEDALPVNLHQVEMFVTTSYELLRVVSVNRFRPREVRFAHACRGLFEEYERVFECPVRFDRPDTEIVISDEMWQLEFEIWDPVLSDRLETLAAELNERIETPGIVGSASQEIRGLLPRRDCDLASVAKALGMSDRTLQRRLHEEATTFRDLLDCTRRSIVAGGLEGNVSREEIARRAGFASARALQRAIDRWREHGELPGGAKRKRDRGPRRASEPEA